MPDEGKIMILESLNILKTRLDKNDEKISDCLFLLGIVYFNNKEFDYSIQSLEEAIKI